MAFELEAMISPGVSGVFCLDDADKGMLAESSKNAAEKKNKEYLFMLLLFYGLFRAMLARICLFHCSVCSKRLPICLITSLPLTSGHRPARLKE